MMDDNVVDQKPDNFQHIIDDLTAVCNSLGKLDENDGTYMKDRDCKPCLREIQRYLNTDAKHHTARCTLGSYNIIRCDLIPLLTQYCDYNEGDPDLFNTIIRLCTNITSSVLLLFGNSQEIENKEEHLKLKNKLLSGLYGYKEAFAQNEKIWSTLNTHLRHNRDDDLIFERIIILIRNILHIPVDSTADMGLHVEFDAHDMCLYRMEKSGMLHTILELASDSNKGAEFCFHLTEIIYLILRDQNPETLAKAKHNFVRQRLDDVDKRRLAELSARNRREREQNQKFSNQLRLKGASFVVQNIRSIGDNPLVLNKPLISSREEVQFDVGKKQLRKAKNKKPLHSETSIYISDKNVKTSRISYGLKVFSEKFIKNVYNDYMQQIKHNLIQKRAQENDESYYLWAIQFFTAFNRHLKLNADYVAETLSTSTLHFISILMTSYQEKLKIEKKEFQDISKRLHLALRAYKEILCLIKTVADDPNYCHKIEGIKKNIFTELEYSTLLLNLFQQYNEPKHSNHYLNDLINANYIFLDLLEEYSKANEPIPLEDDDDDEFEHASDDDDNMMDFLDDNEKIAKNNDNILEDENIKKEVGNEDDLNDKIMNDEDEIADIKNDEDAMGEDVMDKFINEEKESNDLPDFFGNEIEGKKRSNSKKKRKSEKKKKKKNKTDFTSAHFMTRYCSPDVVNSHLKVLKHFKTNDDSINLALLKFFERIVYDCRNDVILCQASVFLCLLEISEYHSSMPGQDGFKTLLIHLIETFGRMANKKRWMFQELLFWKAGTDVIEIENAIDPPPVPTITKVAEDNMSEAANIFPDNEANIDMDANNVNAATNDDELPPASLEELRAELWGSDSDDSSINIPSQIPLQANLMENNNSNSNNNYDDNSNSKGKSKSDSDSNSDSNSNSNNVNHTTDSSHNLVSNDTNHVSESNKNNFNHNLNSTDNNQDSDDSNLPNEINRIKNNKHISDDDDSDIEL